VTHHNALDTELFLRIAPELYLKRLIVGGLERVYEINRNFRNEGIDHTHNPEFTMLEFYQAYATWEDLVVLTEELFAGLVREVCGGESLTYQGREISFARPFRRVRYGDLVAEATGVDARDLPALQAWWVARHADEAAPATLGRMWEAVFDAHVEKSLVHPTFVTHFPVEISPLARRNDVDPDVADRFEIFVSGREIANGFTELADPVDQARRFEAQVVAKAAGDHEAMHFDADYIDALCYGLPPTAGEGIGIDRLVMLLTDSASIRDVILFPTLRPR
jgi:lysyl-tRNA synthetase class 2